MEFFNELSNIKTIKIKKEGNFSEKKELISFLDVSFSNVSYSYPNTSKLIFEKLDFSMKKGQSIGIKIPAPIVAKSCWHVMDILENKLRQTVFISMLCCFIVSGQSKPASSA